VRPDISTAPADELISNGRYSPAPLIAITDSPGPCMAVAAVMAGRLLVRVIVPLRPDWKEIIEPGFASA
jgi:hypothetical protein